MGDQANIVIEADQDMFPHPVFFYTHWSGYKIKPTLQAALVRGKKRWNDSQYLSRVIFCELVGKNDEITGFGITTRIGYSGGKLLCVNMEENKVRERDSSEDITAPVLKEWTFEEFATASFKEDDEE